MPFSRLEIGPLADAGFEATGASLEECFRAAAEALLSLMLENPQDLRVLESRDVRVADPALDLLLVRFLSEIVFHKDADSLFLRVQQLRIEGGPGDWRLTAELAGEKIDPSRHRLYGDVKAITLHRLCVEPRQGGWSARVIVDV